MNVPPNKMSPPSSKPLWRRARSVLLWSGAILFCLTFASLIAGWSVSFFHDFSIGWQNNRYTEDWFQKREVYFCMTSGQVEFAVDVETYEAGMTQWSKDREGTEFWMVHDHRGPDGRAMSYAEGYGIKPETWFERVGFFLKRTPIHFVGGVGGSGTETYIAVPFWFVGVMGVVVVFSAWLGNRHLRKGRQKLRGFPVEPERI